MEMGTPMAEHDTEEHTTRLLMQVQSTGGNRRLRAGLTPALTRTGVSLAARTLLDCVLATGGCRIDDPDENFDRVINGEGAILSCWHNKMAAGLLAFRHIFGRGLCNFRMLTLVSESEDGELAARVFRDLGGNCVRGSSSRRSAEALRDLVRELEAGGAVTIMPDGPRGPRHSIQDGILFAASLSGKPIIPVSGSYGRTLCFEGSWDRFEVPLPFGRFTFHVGRALFVPRSAGNDLDYWRHELLLRMRQVSRQAEAMPSVVYSLGQPKVSHGATA